MCKVIGVGHEASLTQLKRWLLLVDEIAVVHESEKDWSIRPDNPSLAADLDWLTERGIVYKLGNPCKTTVNVQSVSSDGKQVILVPDAGPATVYIRGGSSSLERVTVSQLIDALRDVMCRLECEDLRKSGELDAVSLWVPSPVVLVPESSPTTPGDVLHVVLGAMPVLDDETPLERVIEFRSDPEVKDKLLGFRRWLAGLRKINATHQEIADELEWLLHEYEQHMKIHRLKINKGVLETIVTGAAEIAEDFVKVKWGKLAKLPFSISGRKIELLEAELKAPGREIAFISHARSEFGQL